MPIAHYRFSEGFTAYEEKVVGADGLKAVDLKKSKWDLNRLKHEEEKDYLRILGICWASLSHPRYTQLRFSVPSEVIGDYLKQELGREIRVKPHGERMWDMADLANPTFAYSYVHLPHNLGPDQRRHVLEGVITKAVGNAIWMRSKEYKTTKKPVPPKVRHTKLIFKTRNQNISNLVRLYASNDENKLPWVPYDQMRKYGESHGTWFFDPEPLEDYIFLPELKLALGEMYAFPAEQIVVEQGSLARAGLYEWANKKGELSKHHYDEKKLLSKRIHDQAKGIRRERVSLQKKLSAVRDRLKSIQSIESYDKMRRERDDYKREINRLTKSEEGLLEKMEETNEEVSRLWKEIQGRSPKRNGDTGYARRQWEHERHR